ncbi:hypothetical protein Poli38472_006588 [Pythium oligandrum]|uniref:phospholipase D n=1 Tax=Pythium oligandrum TaxID=41045 RepID=A0A8K1FF98_PYTOL|nr:hypothetical protein Poli38472_006588 [Pythium oligandrum]|eukprot:TMW56578.1 hypothetical protein Poli38472_006588 [Pythium oligandrum]
MDNPTNTGSIESIPELSFISPGLDLPATPHAPDSRAPSIVAGSDRESVRSLTIMGDAGENTDMEGAFENEIIGSEEGFIQELEGEHTDSDDDDYGEESDGGTQDEIAADGIKFQLNRAVVSRSGVIPCCIFVGRVTWGSVDWEIHFGQKQLLRLQISIFFNLLFQKRRLLREANLPWTIWREKRAEKRVADSPIVQDYIRALLADRDIRNSDPLLSFLEVSPSRAMSRYGPSLKEGYVHMRMNGAFQLPLYSCVNRTIEALYRHLYRTWMRVAFISAVVTFIFPLFLIIVTALPQFFSAQETLVSESGEDVEKHVSATNVFLGLAMIAGLIYAAAFVYKFFDHRLGVIRRWVVLKPNCFAAYRRRSDKEPSEVFLFDKTFTARKGSYRQGVSWMPSGLVVGSRAGFIEIDTGHYYTRLTGLATMMLVCWGIMVISSSLYDYQRVTFSGGVPIGNLPTDEAWVNTVRTNSTNQDYYCGYYFRVPENVTVNVRTDDPGAVISMLPDPSSNQSLPVTPFNFFNADDLGFSVGLFVNTVSRNSLVAVTKKVNVKDDLFVDSGIDVNIENLGTVTFVGLNGSTLLHFSRADHFCEIPIRIAIVEWKILWYYIPLLLVGGMITATSGLLLNYLIKYLGLWHAHVRRDHWYRCVRRLQRLKRQQTEHRYRSFAPEHMSSTQIDNCLLQTSAHDPDPPLSTRTKATSDGSLHSEVHSEASFTEPPPPPPCSIAWHVDGEDTYAAMYKAINEAKFEVLIAGWWVTPDLYLLRPGRKLPPRTNENEKKTNETQLRNLLLLKAEQGVKIYVLIYREVKLALTLNSAYTKRSLMLHPNIRVLRDPIFQIQSLGFWSHHEKIVCVDQSLAFVGGLDLCFGRYDHSGHPLSDPGGDKLEDQTWPGKDYSNPIIKDFIRVNKPFEDLIDRPSQPRMPWHDVHCSVSGPAVQDIAYHFIQRWNFVCSKNDYQLRTGWCICFRSRRFKYLPKCLLPMDFNGWTLRYPSSEVTNLAIPDDTISRTAPIYRNESMEIVEDTFRVNSYPNLRTGRLQDNNRTPDSGHSTSELSVDNTLNKPLTQKDGRCASVLNIEHPQANVCSVQVVRSVSMWSAGVPTETSIHEAYLDVINKAKHFIYIENQFFVSGLHSNNVVRNRILQALLDRIERAIVQKEVFRVYVVMPLLPAFEGNIRSEELTNLHAVMHWQFETISRGRHSLFGALQKLTDDPSAYVSFFGLRKYGILPNGHVSTEQIYIHSKLLIADDQYAILGSANINDRSMAGERDSEIALVIEDTQFEDGLMNERPYRRGVVVGALRRQLFREHLGLADDDETTLDPAAEWSWLRIRNISQRNTKIFESVFDCAPSNRMTSFNTFKDIEVTQIFENQRLNVLKMRKNQAGNGRHVWDQANLKPDDYAPWTDVNGVPINMDNVHLDDFVIDNYKDKNRKKLFMMDHDGWLYARNFSVFQEVRMHNFRKRDKIHYFVTDRLMAQVRRRRWVKKDSGWVPPAISRVSSIVDSSDEEEGEHGRFHSLWRRIRRSESSASLTRGNSFSMGNPRGGAQSLNSTMVLTGQGSYPSSPAISNFRQPGSPVDDPSVQFPRGGAGGSERNSMRHSNTLRDSEVHVRHSGESFRDAITASLKKWKDTHSEYSRRSKFADEYFGKDEDSHAWAHSDRDDSLLESGRGSVRSERSVEGLNTGNGVGKPSTDRGEGECQIGHLKTAATVRKEDESRARGQLSEIRGHLVEFPIDFLKNEFLKPAILPHDIHI